MCVRDGLCQEAGRGAVLLGPGSPQSHQEGLLSITKESLTPGVRSGALTCKFARLRTTGEKAPSWAGALLRNHSASHPPPAS